MIIFRNKSVMKLLIFIAIILANALICNCQTYIWYSYFLNESTILYQYFNGHQNGFYVDLGAFHPVIVSNTLKLKTHGWKGINIDANYNKVKLFFTQRKQDLNLNYAIGPQPDKYIQFYESTTESLMSSVDPNVKNKRLIKGPMKSLKVVTISLADLCERYYLKRPQFMNLDVQGVGQYAVLQNDWKNIKCRPQVLMVQINLSSKIAGLEETQKLLTDVGYKKIRQVGQNTVFVDSDVYQKYQAIAKTNMEQYQKLTLQNFADIYTQLVVGKFRIGYKDYFHAQYDNTVHAFFLYFAVKGEDLMISSVRKDSNKLASRPNLIDRPIVVYEFNPRDNLIIVDANYTCEEVQIVQRKYYLLKLENTKLEVYIYNMGHLIPGKLPNIVNVRQNMLVAPSNAYIAIQNVNKQLQLILQQYKEQQSKTTKLTEQKFKQIESAISNTSSAMEFNIKQGNAAFNKQNEETSQLINFVSYIFGFIAIVAVLSAFMGCYSIIISKKIIALWRPNSKGMVLESDEHIENPP